MLSEFPWKTNYASDEDDLVSDFYLPALERANAYDRAVGFFSSSALAIIAPGLDRFVANGGRMRVIASPKNLTDDDLQAIVQGEKLRPLWSSLEAALEEPVGLEELDRLSLLAWMVATGRLDVRIALRVHPDGRVGLYHKKVGVFACQDSPTSEPLEWMTFTGSPNETAGGILINAESFPLHLSWEGGQRPFAEAERALFTTAWKGDRPEIWLWSAQEWLADRLREKFGSREPRDPAVYLPRSRVAEKAEPELPSMPPWLTLHGYQERAIDAWVDAGGRGTFAMATGTGKTETALAAATRVASVAAEARRPILILVIAPLADLVGQWASRARGFGFAPHTWDATTSSNEKELIRGLFRRASAARTGPYTAMVITTADSLTAGLAGVVRNFEGTMLVIGDEMHSLGTQRRLDALPSSPTFTLGLSATPKRHFDDEGTDALLSYFGEPVISINIKQAITEYRALCKYEYHVHFAELTDDETVEYRRLSQRIAAALSANRDADAAIRERTNLVAHAEEKIAVLAELMKAPWRYAEQNHELIYVGEGAPRGSSEPTIQRVSRLLGHTFGMAVATYTSKTPLDERQRLQAELADGGIQALLAMRCLDEGVDIPEARIGIILASTQNPRQFVQRRGRLLRLHADKVIACIHDVLVLPQADADLDSDRTLLASELSRAYELADAAENRADVMHLIRSRAINAGLVEPIYPWMDALLNPLPEWTDGGAKDD